MQQSPGNGNTLCLTFAESVALFAQFGIEAIRQVTNEICTGGCCSLGSFSITAYTTPIMDTEFSFFYLYTYLIIYKLVYRKSEILNCFR